MFASATDSSTTDQLFELAMEFLQGNHFSIDALSKYGVRYLSRVEEASAIEHALRKHTPQSTEEVEINEEDQETQEFLRAVRRAINNWLAEGKVSPSARIESGGTL